MRARFRPMISVIIGTTALATVLSAVPASAGTLDDPPTTPPKSDIVGVGADVTQDVMGHVGGTLEKSGFSANYNATDPAHKLWSYDVSGSATIIPSEGCDPINRPKGTNDGISALKADEAAGTDCIDFARSTRVKNPSTDGDLVFVPYGRDGVTWATFPTKAGGKKFYAPDNLTTSDLTGIFSCTITNWSQVGGADKPIIPYLPGTQYGTRTFFLAAIGVPTPGGCVKQPPDLEVNNGEQIPAADRPTAIFPFSIAAYIAQSGGASDDRRGGSVVKSIEGTKPIVKNKLNPDFAPAFLRLIFNVLKPTELTDPAFKAVFSRKGYICKHTKITQTFGFGVLPKSSCGY